MSTGTPRIVYWNNMPSPYLVGRLNELHQRQNVSIEAWFNMVREPDRSWNVNQDEWLFDARYIPATRFKGRSLHLPLPELREVRPDILVSLIGDSSFVLGSALAQPWVTRHAFRVLPTFDTWFSRSRLKERVKRGMFGSVDGVKVPGPDGAEFATRYGTPLVRVHKVTQSVDVEQLHLAQTLPVEQVASERERLGLHGCVFIYVGRLWRGKGIDTLLEAFRIVRGMHPDVSLVIVGDGVDEDRYRAMCIAEPNIMFTGYVQSADLPRIYALADALVFPTLGDPHGLVVEEAMAAGLPVICTESAGDIRNRIDEGRSGYIVPPADIATLSDRMLRLAANSELRKSMGTTGSELVRVKSHQRYADDFERFVESLMSMPPQQSPFRIGLRKLGTTLSSMLPAREASLRVNPTWR